MTKKCLVILLVLSIVSLSVSGCGLFRRNPQPTATIEAATSIPAGGQPTEPPAAQPTGRPQPSGEGTGDTSDVDLDKAFGVLENLDTYRYRITMEMTTVRESETVTMTFDHLSEVNRTLDARRMTTTNSSSEGVAQGEPTNTMQSIRIGNQSWINVDDGGWEGPMEGFGGPNFEELLIKPEDLMGGTLKLQRVLPDQRVNGIDTFHYTFNKGSLPTDALESWREVKRYDGEVWIAKEDDFVVKTVLLAEGTIETEGELAETTMNLVTEISDVNQPLDIEPPVVVPREDEEETSQDGETPEAMPLSASVMEEIPRMADAEGEMAFGPLVIYSTSAGLDEVAKFYQDELIALGWEMPEEPQTIVNTIVMAFSKDGNSLSVQIVRDPDDDMAHVTLMGFSGE